MDGPDLRLVPFALGCWAVSLAALFAGLGVTLAIGAAGALGVVLTFARDHVARRDMSTVARARVARRHPSDQDRTGGAAVHAWWGRGGTSGGWRWIVAGAFLGVVCGAAATGARLAARDAPEVVALVEGRVSTTVVLTVRDDPRQASVVVGRPATWVVAADLEQAGELRAEVGVLVLASGDGWAGLLPGQRVRVPARFGPSRGGDLRAAVLSTERPPELLGQASWAQRAAGGLRAGLRRACAPLDAATGGLLPGLVVGDTSRLDPAVEQSFRDTGMTHLTAVSGSNVAIVTGAVLLLARWTRAGPRLTAVVCAVSVVGFVILARPSPSVLRAAVMGGIALLALASGRSRAALPALSAGAAVLLMADPELAADAGFALSVLATAGLLLLAPPMRDALRRRGVLGGVAEALAVPAAAQLACGPVVAGISGTLSLVAVPANLFAVPAIAPATVTGVAAALLSPVWPAGAEFAAWLGSWPAWWLVTVARVGAEVPAGVLPWPGGPPGALLLAGLTVLLMIGFRRPGVRRLVAVVALASVLGALPVRVLTGGWPPDGWLVVACDVGQGDATVLNAGHGAAVVVDAGPLPRDVDRCLRELDVDEVPLLLVSHFHVDHIGGLDGVLAGRPVGAVVTTPWPEPAAGRAAVARAAAAHRVPVSDAPESGGWTVGDVRLEVLPAPPERGTRSDPNNNSLMLVATVRGVRVLLTGDAETERQQALLAGGVYVSADVLKVAHHGSAFQDPSLLDAVAPRIALVSVGKGNDYGHPSASVLARLAGRGARVQRTDVSGDLAVVLADGKLSVVLPTRPLE
ncbi:ComEC/Rec2 family competence protein [Catellatospora chokoriensis]|uniref:Competence protein ComEC n=1 Tax=Catellatospora chokoriensis TaxID=310353 RepID=A0A8J3NR00_9ACTN|nr:ComEC/Rec2 family competence protein [Catellatospora chokoriensis]GIF87590.1 competence protein ComEC [Catellatospora chokoriensis]